MSRTGGRDNNRPSGLEAVITLPAKYVMSAIGATISISGFVALVTAHSVKTWVKSHPYPIYIALIVALLIITGTLDYAHNLRKRITVPSDHDRSFYAAALERLPPNGTVIGWLKRNEITEASIAGFPADVLGALERTLEFSQTQSVGFDDTRIAGSFESLTAAIASFCRSVDRWTLAAQARQFRRVVAPPSDSSQSPVSSGAADADLEEETVALTRHHQDLVQAYDKFIRTAHARGIDIDRQAL